MLSDESKKQLKKILDEFNGRSRADSVLLAEAFPLLKSEIGDEMRAWLAQEIEGYGVIEGRREGLPASAETYRQVYVPALRVYEQPDTFTRIEWPPASSRLVFMGASLTELEGLLSDPADSVGYEIPIPITEGMSIPAHIQVRGTVHRDQIERIFGRFRQDFSKVLCDVLGL